LTKEERLENHERLPMSRTRLTLTADDAELLAINALAFIAGEADRLARFAGLTGLDAGDVQAAARAPGFLAGVLVHLLQDEELLLAFTQTEQIKPVMVPLAYRVIPGGDANFEINLEAWR
jgi:Protein of unknown function (DUF3572)